MFLPQDFALFYKDVARCGWMWLKMMFSLLYTFCLHFYLINIHIFDFPDSQLSGLFTAVPTSPDNRGSPVLLNIPKQSGMQNLGAFSTKFTFEQNT